MKIIIHDDRKLNVKLQCRNINLHSNINFCHFKVYIKLNTESIRCTYVDDTNVELTLNMNVEIKNINVELTLLKILKFSLLRILRKKREVINSWVLNLSVNLTKM